MECISFRDLRIVPSAPTNEPEGVIVLELLIPRTHTEGKCVNQSGSFICKNTMPIATDRAQTGILKIDIWMR